MTDRELDKETESLKRYIVYYANTLGDLELRRMNTLNLIMNTGILLHDKNEEWLPFTYAQWKIYSRFPTKKDFQWLK